jgi:hypothetical protein
LHDSTGVEGSSGAEFDARTLVVDSDHVIYHDASRTYRRYSPMVARLGPLCCEREVRLDAGARR